MVQIPTLSSDGISYIISIITDSMIDRSPLAPVFRSVARCATSFNASSVEFQLHHRFRRVSDTVLPKHFSVLFKIRKSASSIRSSRGYKETGTRPINSGIKPNFTRSCGSIIFNNLSISVSFLLTISALKPMEPVLRRFSMIFSRPSKPAADKQDISSIDLDQFLMRCFLPSLRGNTGNGCLPESLIMPAEHPLRIHLW